MTEKMRAFRLHEFGTPPRWATVDIPDPPEGGYLVSVEAVGLCRSDLYIVDMTPAQARAVGWAAPFTLGHEIAGVVQSAGPGADQSPVGRRVLVDSGAFCGSCFHCRTGADNNCVRASAGRGYGVDGGLADYVTVPSRNSFHVVDDLDPHDAAPLCDAAATAFHGLDRVLPLLDEEATLVIVGLGGLGSYALQAAKHLSSARVVAVDIDDTRADIGTSLGADEFVTEVDLSRLVADAARSDRGGVDAVLDFVGTSKTVSGGVASVRPGGAYGLIGSGGGSLRSERGWYFDLPRDGSVFTYQGSSRCDVASVIELARAGVFSVPIEVFPADRIDGAYRRLRESAVIGRSVASFVGA